MDVSRAKEIINSDKKIEVQFQGQSVWIDGVDENTATARVHPTGSPTNSMTVSVAELTEK